MSYYVQFKYALPPRVERPRPLHHIKASALLHPGWDKPCVGRARLPSAKTSVRAVPHSTLRTPRSELFDWFMFLFITLFGPRKINRKK